MRDPLGDAEDYPLKLYFPSAKVATLLTTQTCGWAEHILAWALGSWLSATCVGINIFKPVLRYNSCLLL